MPKPSLHVLAWSPERQRYELSTHGHLRQSFHPGDRQHWQGWLSGQTSFAFHGRQGQMSVIQEVRPRGAGYWYAYSTHHRHTRKRYLGPTPRVTLERLEQEAQALAAARVAPPQKMRQALREAPGSSPRRGHVLLLETKYTLPRLPSTLIRRERLLNVLDAALSHRLLVCSASAGAGKTTLLSAWAAQSPHQVAWLSLDASDNEPARFWAAIIVALRHSSPSLSQVGDLALDMVHAAQPPPLSTVLTTLIGDVQSCSGEIILILDDYHVIEDRVIQDAMLFLLDHLPANLHLVLSCRVDPALPLSRWRVRGQLIEIREAELRFTREEADSFLRGGMRLPIAEEEVGLLAARTEGWIAGLQLAALSLRTQTNPAAAVQNFTGGQRFILDYVQEEILRRLPLAVQNFLLHIAILDRMNAALCQALTGEPASQEILETLEQRNLFVIPLDSERQWYRLHSLFRDVLLARLRATQPELMMDLHQRAARWYEGEGYVHETVAHALVAKDYSLVASVLERAAPQLWMQGEARTISTWLLMFPDDVVQTRLNFVLVAALHLLWRTQAMPDEPREEGLVKSERLIARVEQILQNAREQAEEMRLYNRIRLLRGLVHMSEAFREGDMRRLRSIAEQLQPLTVREQVAWKWLPLYGLFISAGSLGDAVLLLPDLLAMKQQALQEQDRPTAIVVMCWIAAALLYGGYLRLLQQECLQAQGLLEQAGLQVAVGAYPAFDLSFLYYERNQLQKAEACLRSVMDHAQRWQDVQLLAWSSGIYVKVLLASGKLAEAEQALQEAQSLVQRAGLAVYEASIMAAQVALWLAQGNLSAAGAWAEHYRFNPNAPEYLRQEEYLALACVYLAQRQYEQCLRLLVPLLSSMERLKRQWDVIHLLALQTVALYGLGETAQACQIALRLLALTEPEGYVRVYLDAGEPMRRVLETLLAAPHEAISTSAVSHLLAAFEQEKGSLPFKQEAGAADSSVNRAQSSASVAASPFEPLSPQECRVFRLLIAGRTYAEIAQELIVSLNTVKTQVSSIYRKLGVSRRAEASAVARQLQLL
jgi:LuxR family maltose regulon positive regulatory protein